MSTVDDIRSTRTWLCRVDGYSTHSVGEPMTEYGRYLGNGVYAAFDNHHIVLASANPLHKGVVLDNEVMAALNRYHRHLVETKQMQEPEVEMPKSEINEPMKMAAAR